MTSRKSLQVVGPLVGVCLAASFTAVPAWGQGGAPAQSTFRPPAGAVSAGQQSIVPDLHSRTPGRELELAEKSLRAQLSRKAALPLNRSEIKCAVFKWDPNPPKPAIVVVCPPREIFAPVHVYLKLTWKALSDVPRNFSKIVAAVGSQTKIKTSKEDVRLQLKVGEAGDENSGTKWITFNQLEGVALEGE